LSYLHACLGVYFKVCSKGLVFQLGLTTDVATWQRDRLTHGIALPRVSIYCINCSDPAKDDF
jgi:hypothetical protein